MGIGNWQELDEEEAEWELRDIAAEMESHCDVLSYILEGFRELMLEETANEDQLSLHIGQVLQGRLQKSLASRR